MKDIWLTHPERFSKTIKSVVFDDKGSLKIENNLIRFKGQKGIIDIQNIEDISLVNSKFNWGNFILVVIFTISYGVFAIKSYLFTGVILTFVISIFFLLKAKQKWIKIDFDSDNKDNTIYLSDGSGRGWKGMFGGTEKLFNKMKKQLTHR
jgi:hypothetical protein